MTMQVKTLSRQQLLNKLSYCQTCVLRQMIYHSLLLKNHLRTHYLLYGW